MKEDIGDLAVQNGNGKAWLCWQGNLLQINLDDHSVTILARNVNASDLQVSDSGLLAAWNDEDSGDICLLNTSTGVVSRIEAGDGEVLKTLGFMEEDLIYGAGYSSDIYTDQAGKEMQRLYCVTIRDQAGKDVRQFEYSSKGKICERGNDRREPDRPGMCSKSFGWKLAGSIVRAHHLYK